MKINPQKFSDGGLPSNAESDSAIKMLKRGLNKLKEDKMKSLGVHKTVAFSVVVASMILSPFANADVTSPSIKDRGHKYSTEKPQSDYYGTGTSGRLVEASALRVQVDDLLTAGEFEKAIPKAKKAVQLDPGDPSGHLYLARALTSKFYAQKGEVDESLLGDCLREWQQIRYHDADPSEQWEAGNQAKQLQKIAKALEKQRLIKEKEELARANEVAKKDAEKARHENAGQVAAKGPAAGDAKDASANDGRQVAEHKRRFGIF